MDGANWCREIASGTAPASRGWARGYHVMLIIENRVVFYLAFKCADTAERLLLLLFLPLLAFFELLRSFYVIAPFFARLIRAQRMLDSEPRKPPDGTPDFTH